MTKRGKAKNVEKMSSEEPGDCDKSFIDAVLPEDTKPEVDVEDADNDSPVHISWKDGKEAFKEGEKKRKEAVDFVRSKVKEKRRKKNDMFVSQKRRKTDKRRFELTKLPHDIVLALANKPKVNTNNEQKQNPLVEKVTRKEKLSRKGREGEEKVRKYEHCDVVVVEDEVKKPKKIQDSAVKFLENHLYGNRIHRVSPSSNLSSQCKSFGKMKPALKFNSKT